MAIERVTLGDIRAAAKQADGVRTGGWSSSDPIPLAEALQEMADDILKWFNPNQGWKLVGVSTGFISPQRLSESFDREELARSVVVKQTKPDRFTPTFHFDANNPPLTKGLLGKFRVFDFPQVFTPELRDRVHITDLDQASVHADKIGAVLPLDKALEELSSPYYLIGVNVSSNIRDSSSFISWGGGKTKENTKNPASSRSLLVMVFMEDLLDFAKMEINRLRRAQSKLEKKFPLHNPTESHSAE